MHMLQCYETKMATYKPGKKYLYVCNLAAHCVIIHVLSSCSGFSLIFKVNFKKKLKNILEII